MYTLVKHFTTQNLTSNSPLWLIDMKLHLIGLLTTTYVIMYGIHISSGCDATNIPLFTCKTMGFLCSKKVYIAVFEKKST